MIFEPGTNVVLKRSVLLLPVREVQIVCVFSEGREIDFFLNLRQYWPAERESEFC